MFENLKNKRRMSKGVEIEDSIMTVTQKEEAMIEMPFQKRGLVLIWYAIIIIILSLAGRVLYLDFFRGQYYSDLSKYNRIRNVIIKAPRGMIYDKYGKILARNIPSIDAIIIPSDLPEDRLERKMIALEIAEILDMNSGNVELILDNQDRKSLNPVLLKENVNQEQVLIISEKRASFPGIGLEKTAIRHYEDGSIFAHIIGYDGKITRQELSENPDYMMTDYIGKSGLEKSYEKDIRGKYGALQVEVNALGEIKRTIGIINPVSGNDLVLNIDQELQKKIYDEINEILAETGTASAAAVAIDPRNGGVLAMVSVPSFDNNLFSKGIGNDDYKKLITDTNLPLFNRCVNGEYPPGSTIKPAVAAAALSEKIVSPSTIINGLGGALYVGSYRFRDWKAHGPSDIRTAIAESNDIFFYTVGGGYGEIEGLGMSRMKKYENLFGFGMETGIDLPSESTGLIPDEQWKKDKIGEKWYIGDSYHAAIGQGFLTATPLQLASYTASLANGGTLYAPRLVNRVKKGDQSEGIIPPKVIRHNFIEAGVMKVVREGMRKTVTDGTARSLNTLKVPVAGKTGTSEFGSEGKTHSWFISFAPYDDPVIAMAVIVPGGGEGNSASLPVTQATLQWYFEEKNASNE